MRKHFNCYYRFERTFHNHSINKYELIENKGHYKQFDKIKTQVLRAILYQSERVVFYEKQKQGKPELTLLVPWEKENKIGFFNHGNDVIVFNISPEYERVELFILRNSWLTDLDVLNFIRENRFNHLIWNIG